MTYFISLRTQYENLGDEVINSLLIRELARRGRVVALASGVPAWYVSNIRQNVGDLDIEIVDNPKAFYACLLKALVRGRTHLFISCGDVTEVNNGSRRDWVLGVLMVFPGFILSQLGASVARISQTRARLFRRALKRKRSISVRDSNSIRILKNAGVCADRIPDLAYLLKTSQSANKRKRIIFSFRAKNAEERQNIEAFVASILPALHQHWEVMTTAQVEHDIALNKALANQHGLTYVPLLEPRIGRLTRALEFYDTAEVIISNRLHGLLVAASRGAYPVPILMPGEVKVRSVMRDAEIGVIDFDQAAPARVLELLAGANPGDETLPKIFSREATDIRTWIDCLVGSPVGSING